MASEVAANIGVGLLAPIYSQLDPLRLAEMDRSLRIAKEYGERAKTDNVKDGTVERLLVKYPSHGFVIDKKEARALFNNVEDPDDELMAIGRQFELIARYYIDRENDTFVWYLSTEASPPAPPPPSPEAPEPPV